MNEATITIYAHNDMVAIETPGGVCYVHPQVAIEITVSLTRAALSIDPDMDPDAIVDAFIPHRESVQ